VGTPDSTPKYGENIGKKSGQNKAKKQKFGFNFSMREK
jgi:hypothetical protein